MYKSILAPIAFALIGTGLMLPVAHAQPATKRQVVSTQQVVVHLSKDTADLHAVFMAVKLATMLRKKGADVTMFLDLEGVRLADQRQPNDLRWGSNKSSLKSLYLVYVKAGGKVLVCPHCAKAQGLTRKSLRAGAKIAAPEQLATLLLEADKILDY